MQQEHPEPPVEPGRPTDPPKEPHPAPEPEDGGHGGPPPHNAEAIIYPNDDA